MKETKDENSKKQISKGIKVSKIKYIIIMLIILALLMILIFTTYKEVLPNILDLNLKRKGEVEKPLVSCVVYDNQNIDKLKAIIVINDKDGVEYVEFPDGTIIYANGKNELAKDIELKLNEEYNVKVVTSVEEKNGKIQLDENYIRDYIEFKRNDNRELEIDYKQNILNMNTKKYKFGAKNNIWNDYNNLVKLNLSCIDIEDYIKENYIANIYAKHIDDSGENILEETQEIYLENKGEFDIFENTIVSGMGENISDYGFALTSYSNLEYYEMKPYYLYAAHYDNLYYYNVTYTLDWEKLKTINFKELYVGAVTFNSSEKGYANVYTTINYKDGTTSETCTNTGSIIREQSKEINNVTFHIARYDGRGGGSGAYVNQLILKRHK